MAVIQQAARREKISRFGQLLLYEACRERSHYAFFVCDGRFNMDMEEASACAELVNARHSIPYHMAPGQLFDPERAELFTGPGKLILAPGEELPLEP